MDPFMYHGPCTVYHVRNLASFARGVAEQEQGKFLKRRGFVSGKALRCTMDPFMYHVPMYRVPCEEFGELCSRGCEAGARQISEAARFCVRKGSEMYHGPFQVNYNYEAGRN